ncbi:sugar phosphate isomerase/epimerase [Saccharopolyspora erythraea NRRL 2338]|uniref:Sugar phosphate isomerase/epimerase n=2 Tax=Saccharopolyspora erythraea TaxID=1836 RepID=A4FDR0_SACEN|nr:sugar phosphate isomerase/epimerase [Saccharopolyspora erythraea]EQD82625.1 sugar phosphate isomerase [Saccharopolyspora erythraea D]PFG95918.1 sugar phosphate isomerase/epimerase [Saccharopolyspora erythraea NRRL 2338]QRK92488.1 sugar phosphate isomerase/epimerase [Saccharopolyspora erythraea]CAM02185.1 sugar phosphate isomerase/epimerase [Saccharopolyspora erythraea NRRL 2338]
MPLKLGAYTACLHDRPLEDALDFLKANGLTSVEVNTGGFIPAPHCPVDLLLSSEQARADYLETFASRGMELTGLNCNGNPLNPLPGVGPKHASDVRRTIELAGLLGVRNVVTMSGTPGSDPDAKYPSWVVNPWDGVYMDVLDYQWDVAAEFWTETDALARANDVRVAIEMHPHNLVFSPVTLEKLVELTGATNLGAEMDPSHLMWQGMDVVACIRRLGPLVFHAAAKDATLCKGVDVRGVLDTSFERVPAETPGKTPTGIGFWCNSWPTDPAWKFVAVGIGHDTAYWTQFLGALAEIDPDMAVNIEHEDAAYSQTEGLALAAKNLREAAADL